MGFYADRILPRLINFGLNTGECKKWRARVTPHLRGSVLEVGFGSGLNLPFLPPTVDQLYALDPARLGRRLARQRLAQCPVPVEFVDLVDDSIPLEDDSVDAVLSTWTLCTISDLPRALADMRRVLRPGGRLHFLEHGLSSEPNVARWQHRLNPIQRRLFGGCQLIVDVEAAVRDAGFVIESVEHFTMKGPKFATTMFHGRAVDSAAVDADATDNDDMDAAGEPAPARGASG